MMLSMIFCSNGLVVFVGILRRAQAPAAIDEPNAEGNGGEAQGAHPGAR